MAETPAGGAGLPSQAAGSALAAAGGAPVDDKDVDWSSVDQVSQLVSRTTMGAMQQLWRQHAAGMDELGRAFAERMYDSHSKAVKEIAEVKDFDLRAVLSLLNSFTNDTRELVLQVMQDARRSDDDFTQQLYQTTRSSFARNLRAALEARDAWYREKLRGLRQRHDAQLAAVRHAAAVELQQRQMQLKIALARTLAKSARGDNPGLMLGLLGGRAGQAASSSAAALGGVNAAGAAGQGDGTSTTPGGAATASGGAAAPDPSTVNSGASPAGAAGAGSTPVRSSTTAALAAVVNAAASSGAGGGEGLSGLGLGMSGGELGPEAAMLEELFEDANAADALNRELEASLARANADLVDLREKLAASQEAAQEAATEASQWRSKWAIESTKTDSIKRESMAIIAKCEEHLTQLQQQHIAEISQRDYLLQRCRDTINALEAKQAAVSASPLPSASGAGGTVAGHSP
ncbi:hypothetical protein CHLRE_02g103700v5 [Chlamydomonas reinhardtii]|uniref:Uncharacterized protein n=1 Tax=Chlamydomonas reinhardtii TaxID=3055 RepID=A0A2K3E2H5_CHLRE|nr:uncharacterized protein CHLRE_02g103700v5 [Chlamydomonas reinhardtii]PNW86974.1 hypothetical protein CHLRE_02g103700v5 [Chlamydomonas reinhardtii]